MLVEALMPTGTRAHEAGPRTRSELYLIVLLVDKKNKEFEFWYRVL